MSNVRVARRYAEALMNLAEEQKQLDRVADDLQAIQRLTMASHDLVLFLKSPVINKEKKLGIFAELFQKKVTPLTLHFLSLLTEKSREDILPQIIEQFFVLHDERLGIVNVQVKAIGELTRDQGKLLQQRLESHTKKKVRFTLSVDKLLKGGFVARVGDTVFDGSVKRQLELMKERFAEGAVTS